MKTARMTGTVALLAGLLAFPAGLLAQTVEIPLVHEPGAPGAGADREDGGPEALAFDGTHVWVTRQFANTVTRVRAADGVPVAVFPVGERPTAVLADDSGIWVANTLGNTVTRLRAWDGALLATIERGTSPPDWRATARTSGSRTAARAPLPSSGPGTERCSGRFRWEGGPWASPGMARACGWRTTSTTP